MLLNKVFKTMIAQILKCFRKESLSGCLRLRKKSKPYSIILMTNLVLSMVSSQIFSRQKFGLLFMSICCHTIAFVSAQSRCSAWSLITNNLTLHQPFKCCFFTLTVIAQLLCFLFFLKLLACYNLTSLDVIQLASLLLIPTLLNLIMH